MKKRVPDNLVDRVVAPDVLTGHAQPPVCLEETCRMESTGAAENRLRRPKRPGQLQQHIWIEPQALVRRRDLPRAHGVDRCLAADAAARRREKVSLESDAIDR